MFDPIAQATCPLDRFSPEPAYGSCDCESSLAVPLTSFEDPLAPKVAHIPERAKHCIFLYMYGGPSQMDLFDYTPELQKRDGQKIQMEIRRVRLRMDEASPQISKLHELHQVTSPDAA